MGVCGFAVASTRLPWRPKAAANKFVQLGRGWCVHRPQPTDPTHFNDLLSSITKYLPILPRIIKYYRVLPSFTEFYRVLPSFTEFYRIFHVPSGLSLNSIDFSLVPQGMIPFWNKTLA